MKLLPALLLSGLFFADGVISQNRPPLDISRLLATPHQYQVMKTTGPITVDGRSDERQWDNAPWTEDFVDIETGRGTGANMRSRCKMLWDSDNLYVFAEFRDQNVWGSITQHDASVFQDNAFEIFINPDGSTFNYFEFQINALNTVWDLFMPRPYRSGGRGLSSWDIGGLQKAVYIAGTLNDPRDKDVGWSVELAIPFSALGVWKNAVKAGTIWRMNFSRVAWEIDSSSKSTSGYVRKADPKSGRPLPPNYYVWSPQGLVDLHYPERYGFVRFVDAISNESFLLEPAETLRLKLWKYYYLQQRYKNENGKYAASLDILDKMAGVLPTLNVKDAEVKMFSDDKQFLLQANLPGAGNYYSLDHEGEFKEAPLVKQKERD